MKTSRLRAGKEDEMKPDIPFVITYAHDRRKHRHRCMCCNKIIQAGETVLMIRLTKGCKAVHNTCADNPCIEEYTWRDSFDAWATERAIKLGFNIQPHPMQKPGLSI